MRTLVKQSLLLTSALIVLLAFAYPLLIWGVAQFAGPNQGKGETIERDGRIIGFANVGQPFSSDRYFNGRPSAIGYNASGGSYGSNAGPTNPDYLATVQTRIDTFLAHNPGVPKSEIPADLVTASGSGLDPHISRQGAFVQIARVAKARNLGEDRVRALVEGHVEAPLLGLFGVPRVNVLRLNLALDELR